MIVPEIAKWPFDHCVVKVHWTVHFGDRDRHVKPQSKMSRPPLHLLSLADQTRGNAADRFFFRIRNGMHVKIYAPGQIKTSFQWGFYRRLQENLRASPL